MKEKNVVEAGSGEERVSSVTEGKKPAIKAGIFFVLALVCVLIVGLATILVTRYQAKRREAAQAKQESSQVTTASNAGAQPLKVTGNPAGVPPTVGGVQPNAVPPDPRAQLNDRAAFAIPAIDPDATDVGALGVRATGSNPSPGTSSATGKAGLGGSTASQPSNPLDAPIILSPAPAIATAARGVPGSTGATSSNAGSALLDDAIAQTRARLDETRARLDQQLAGLSGTKAQVPNSVPPSKAVGADDGLKLSSTARIGAARLVSPTLTLPRGMTFTCALANKIVSEQVGPVSCVVARNVYGHDGRILLIERGSHLDGAYHAQLKVGQTRVAVIWDRLRMPNGVVVDLASPATGPLGEVGVDGALDNHWPQRIGAALLLSILDDAVKIEIAKEQARANVTGTVVLQGSGTDTSTLAGKVLDTTVNIPPTVVKNQGEIVAVNVARDIDFSTVYELHASKLQ